MIYEIADETGENERIEAPSLGAAMDYARGWASDDWYIDGRISVDCRVQLVGADGELVGQALRSRFGGFAVAGPETLPPRWSEAWMDYEYQAFATWPLRCGDEDDDHAWGDDDSCDWLDYLDRSVGVGAWKRMRGVLQEGGEPGFREISHYTCAVCDLKKCVWTTGRNLAGTWPSYDQSFYRLDRA